MWRWSGFGSGCRRYVPVPDCGGNHSGKPAAVPASILLKSILLGLLVIALSAGCQPQGGEPIDALVDIGTHSLHIQCEGSGSPVIVIDTGLGDSITSWQTIREQLAQETRVCGYERAGYGQSQPGPLPRHARQCADELHALLHAAGVKEPYLLVGHSLGGLNLQVFASQYPAGVHGLVLLDPPPLAWISGGEAFQDLHALAERQTQELVMAAEIFSLSSDPADQAKETYFEVMASEHEEAFGDSAQQATSIDSFAQLPLVVIASGKPNPAFGLSAADFQQFWIEQSRALAGKSSQGQFILAGESGHQIHLDAPAVVIEAIRKVLEEQ